MRRPAEFSIKDVDVVYFDAIDLAAEAEAEYEKRQTGLFRDLPFKLDVENQPRVHSSAI